MKNVSDFVKHGFDDTHATDRPGHFNRRDLLAGSVLLGASMLPEIINP